MIAILSHLSNDEAASSRRCAFGDETTELVITYAVERCGSAASPSTSRRGPPTPTLGTRTSCCSRAVVEAVWRP